MVEKVFLISARRKKKGRRGAGVETTMGFDLGRPLMWWGGKKNWDPEESLFENLGGW